MGIWFGEISMVRIAFGLCTPIIPRQNDFCLFGFNVAFKHLRSYHDGACL